MLQIRNLKHIEYYSRKIRAIIKLILEDSEDVIVFYLSFETLFKAFTLTLNGESNQDRLARMATSTLA
jgi:hypothetical protein